MNFRAVLNFLTASARKDGRSKVARPEKRSPISSIERFAVGQHRQGKPRSRTWRPGFRGFPGRVEAGVLVHPGAAFVGQFQPEAGGGVNQGVGGDFPEGL